MKSDRINEDRNNVLRIYALNWQRLLPKSHKYLKLYKKAILMLNSIMNKVVVLCHYKDHKAHFILWRRKNYWGEKIEKYTNIKILYFST